MRTWGRFLMFGVLGAVVLGMADRRMRARREALPAAEARS